MQTSDHGLKSMIKRDILVELCWFHVILIEAVLEIGPQNDVKFLPD